MALEIAGNDRRGWPEYATVWRWHFYAGLFCIPFVCWLALTGSIYLFRPDIEAFLDRPYENLKIAGERGLPSQEAEAAVAAVKGSHFSRYEPPATATGAAQVVVSRGDELIRVYVQPATLKPMKIVQDAHRLMEILAKLHSSFLLGPVGSVVMELAASWAIVMILTGLFLWFPRNRKGFAGILYPRLGKRGRIYWRDLHAVTGMWVSLVALFMLLSGLPWSYAWGNYLTWARNLSTITSGAPDWPVGGEAAKAKAGGGPSSMPGMTAAEMAAMAPSATHTMGMGMSAAAHDAMLMYALDLVAPTAMKLDVPRPVWILPPAAHGDDWTVSSQAQDRPERVTYTVSGMDGQVTGRAGFADQNVVDRVVNVGVAAHEGHLFGRINQAILLVTALSLIGMTASAVVMWVRRKPKDLLGAPRPAPGSRSSGGLVAAIFILALVIPLFALSLLAVLIVEWVVLRRVPGVGRWLGLRSAARV
ncbi:PepSY domain-containing protein [Sphingosinicellaceae bacterium]|nr:PepSY domain-containing protein [Sphingosinicellaceae bacterium]